MKPPTCESVTAHHSNICLPTLLCILISIVNHSRQTCFDLTHLKNAQLSPILKKFNLDPEILNIYHLIFNLFTFPNSLNEV